MQQDYQNLLAQKAELNKRIEEARRQESAAALAQIKEWIATFGFTAQQVFPWDGDKKPKVVAKYYDPESGKSWTGRGKPPKWIEGKDRAQYEIQREPAKPVESQSDENNPFPIHW